MRARAGVDTAIMTERARLQLIGAVTLRNAAGDVLPLPGRRAGALLAFLALEGDRAHTRASLAELLWADRAPTAARAALRQALHVLRAALPAGAGALRADHRAVRLDVARLDVDASALERAAARREFAVVRDRRTGALAGLAADVVPPTAAYDGWLAGRRARFAATVEAGLMDLMERDLGAGDWREALVTARLLHAADPSSEAAAVGVVRALDGLHEPARAQAFARAFADRLEAELGPKARSAFHARLAGPVEPGTVPTPQAAAPSEPVRLPALLTAVHVAGAPDPAARRRALEEAERILGDRGGVTLARTPDSLSMLSPAESLRATGVVGVLDGALQCRRTLTDAGIQAGVGVGVATALAEGPSTAPWAGTAERAEVERLAAQAAPGEVIAGHAIMRLAGAERFGFATAILPQTWRCERRIAGIPRSRWVGRRVERAQLDVAADAVFAGGRARIARLLGEPGIGKTRLLEEVTALRGDAAVLLRRPVPETTDAEFLHALASALDDTERLPPTVEGDATTRARLRIAAVIDTVGGAAASSPRMIAIDNVETLGGDDADELYRVVDALADAPVFWLLAERRASGREGRRAVHPVTRVPGLTLELAALGTEDAASLAAQYDVDDAIRAACLARAGGNPLFLEQLLLHPGGRGEAELPPSIKGAIHARIAHLESVERRALAVAAVLGDAAPVRAVCELAAVGEATLRELAAQRLVVAPGEAVRFAHPLVREVLLDSLSRRGREDLHHRCAAWWAPRDAVRHAEHLAEAGAETAPAALLEAAREARKRRQPALAVRLARRGRASTQRPSRASRLAVVEGWAHLDLGASAPALDAVDDGLARAVGDEEVIDALIARAACFRVLDDIPAGLGDLDAAGARLRPGDPARRAAVALLRGRLLFALGRAGDSASAHTVARESAKAGGDVETEALALGGLADAAYAAGRLATAGDHVAESLALCRAHDLERTAIVQQSLATHLGVYLGRPRQAGEEAAAAARTAARMGEWRAEINLRLAVASAAFALDEPERCAEAARAARRLVARSGAWRFDVVALLYLVRVAMRQGDRTVAQDWLDEAREGAMTTAPAVYGAQVAALAACVSDDGAAVARHLDEGGRYLAEGAVAHNHFRFYPNAAWAARRVGDWRRYSRIEADFRTFASAEPNPWTSAHLAAVAAWRSGDPRALVAAEDAATTHGYVTLARACRTAEPDDNRRIVA